MGGFQVQVFDIQLEKEVYREGENVIGTLTVVNEEELKIKSLRLDVCGVAVIHWDGVGMDQDVDPIEKIKGDHSREVYFSKSITLIHKEGGLLDKQLSTLTSGTHEYPFEVKLPQELPCSFEGKIGRIRYMAKATIYRPKKPCVITRKVFTVLSGLDLNFIPEAAVKIELCKQKELGNLCCNKGEVTADWCVDSSGFVPGQDILISGAIQNESHETVSCSKVTLLQVIDYKSNKRHRQQKRPLVTVDRGETEPSEVTVWQERLHIPPVPPTGLGRCRLIDVNYQLQFLACFEGKINPITFHKDIYIGTVPICYQEMKSCVAGMFNQPYHESNEFIDVETMQLCQQIDQYTGCGVGQSAVAADCVSLIDSNKTRPHITTTTCTMPPATSTVSLTKIIAAVCKTEPTTSPSAPPRMESQEHLCSAELEGGGGAGPHHGDEERPPPYAPGHTPPPPHTTHYHTQPHTHSTAYGTATTVIHKTTHDDDVSETSPLMINSTTTQEDKRAAHGSSLYPALASSWFDSVSLATTDSSSTPIQGDHTYNPVYPYYTTTTATAADAAAAADAAQQPAATHPQENTAAVRTTQPHRADVDNVCTPKRPHNERPAKHEMLALEHKCGDDVKPVMDAHKQQRVGSEEAAAGDTDSCRAGGTDVSDGVSDGSSAAHDIDSARCFIATDGCEDGHRQTASSSNTCVTSSQELLSSQRTTSAANMTSTSSSSASEGSLQSITSSTSAARKSTEDSATATDCHSLQVQHGEPTEVTPSVQHESRSITVPHPHTDAPVPNSTTASSTSSTSSPSQATSGSPTITPQKVRAPQLAT